MNDTMYRVIQKQFKGCELYRNQTGCIIKTGIITQNQIVFLGTLVTNGYKIDIYSDGSAIIVKVGDRDERFSI